MRPIPTRSRLAPLLVLVRRRLRIRTRTLMLLVLVLSLGFGAEVLRRRSREHRRLAAEYQRYTEKCADAFRKLSQRQIRDLQTAERYQREAENEPDSYRRRLLTEIAENHERSVTFWKAEAEAYQHLHEKYARIRDVHEYAASHPWLSVNESDKKSGSRGP